MGNFLYQILYSSEIVVAYRRFESSKEKTAGLLFFLFVPVGGSSCQEDPSLCLSCLIDTKNNSKVTLAIADLGIRTQIQLTQFLGAQMYLLSSGAGDKIMMLIYIYLYGTAFWIQKFK